MKVVFMSNFFIIMNLIPILHYNIIINVYFQHTCIFMKEYSSYHLFILLDCSKVVNLKKKKEG